MVESDMVSFSLQIRQYLLTYVGGQFAPYLGRLISLHHIQCHENGNTMCISCAYT